MLFKRIINENQLLMIGISYLVGRSLYAFLDAFINNVIMPLFTAAIGGKEWENATISLFHVDIKWGSLMASCLHFIVALCISVYMIHWFVKPKEERT